MLSWLEISSLKGPLEVSPLFGHCPRFDQAAFAKHIQSHLKITLETFDSKWSMAELDGARLKLAPDTVRYAFFAAPFKGLFEVFIPRQQLQGVMAHYFGPDSAIADSLEQSFLDLFVAHFMSSLCHVPALQFIKPTLCARTTQISSKRFVEGSLVFKFDAFELSVIVWIDEALHQSWLRHWELQPSLQIDSQVAKSVDLNMSLQLGQIELNAKELHQLKVGDWIHLGLLGIGEDLSQAQVDLMLEKRKVARAQISSNNLKIISRDDFFDRLACK